MPAFNNDAMARALQHIVAELRKSGGAGGDYSRVMEVVDDAMQRHGITEDIANDAYTWMVTQGWACSDVALGCMRYGTEGPILIELVRLTFAYRAQVSLLPVQFVYC